MHPKARLDPSFGRRERIVGVMGSSEDPHTELAGAVGRLLAAEGYHLLTGGGGGVMAAVSEAFAAVPRRRGKVIGVLRAAGTARTVASAKARRSYALKRAPNPWVEIPVYTHLPLSGAEGKDPLSRNHINVLTADAVVVLPGGSGTLSELELAVEYGWPVILCIADHTVGGHDAAALAQRFGPAVGAASGVPELRDGLKRLLG